MLALAATTLATLLASAAAAPISGEHRALFAVNRAPASKFMVHHINSTITPPRCGQTMLVGNNAFVKYTFRSMSRTYPLANGTCASAGFSVPAGPQDMATQQTWSRRYKYNITFFHKQGSAGAPAGGKGGQGAGPTVVGLAVATPTLSTLVAAVKAAGLVGALSAKGPFTVFAPTNAAFAALGAAVPTLLKPENKALLDKVLEYHVIAGKAVMASQIKDGMTAKTLEGQPLTFGIDGGVVSVDDATVSKANIVASNGVVHVINKVLLFPGFKLPSGGACADDVSFRDSYGTCMTYQSSKWCAGGAIGPAWKRQWGALDAKAKTACCACGGGSHN